jgi:hypothetical protein
MTSATAVPVSACFSAKEICSSVNLLFFTALLLPSGSHKTGKLAFKLDEENGKTSLVLAPAGACRRSWSGLRLAESQCSFPPFRCRYIDLLLTRARQRIVRSISAAASGLRRYPTRTHDTSHDRSPFRPGSITWPLRQCKGTTRNRGPKLTRPKSNAQDSRA